MLTLYCSFRMVRPSLISNNNTLDNKEIYDNIDKFVQLIGKPESICSMCPESRSHAVDHYAKGEVHVKHLD